jgi:hypothetical protein
MDTQDSTWYVDKTKYTIEEVAIKLRKFYFEEHYEPTIKTGPHAPAMGFLWPATPLVVKVRKCGASRLLPAVSVLPRPPRLKPRILGQSCGTDEPRRV